MEMGYVALGFLCIFYYVCLVLHTKRMNSSLSLFWFFYGLWNMRLGAFIYKAPDYVDYIILTCSIVIWMIYVVIELIILCAMVAVSQKNLDYIIILGAQIKGKKITNALERRLNKGLAYLRENPKTMCIVSGGKGKGEEITEAEAMAEYLLENGIEKERICLDDKSKTTWQNLEYSQQFIRNLEETKTGIVTNNFHIYRSVKIAELQGYKEVFALPATTNMIVFPNYMTREFLALGKMFILLKIKKGIKL